jgi:hypothetical protein
VISAGMFFSMIPKRPGAKCIIANDVENR